MGREGTWNTCANVRLKASRAGQAEARAHGWPRQPLARNTSFCGSKGEQSLPRDPHPDRREGELRVSLWIKKENPVWSQVSKHSLRLLHKGDETLAGLEP